MQPTGRGRRAGAGRTRAEASSAAPAAAPPAEETPPEVKMEIDGSEGQTTEAAAAPTRRSAQRLESLRTTEAGPSSTRRTASAKAKKPAAVKPVNTGRRSKADREQLQKSVAQREKERLAELKAEERAKQKDRPFKKREPGEVKGLHSAAVAGPFSLGSVARERRSASKITSFGSRATRIKHEDDEEGTTGTVRREDGGTISSGEEDGEDVPRQDIDTIEISSDEDEAGGSRQRSSRSQGASSLLPVRIGRREHVDRVVGINTEASSEAAAKILEQAEATGGEIKADAADIAPRKGKGKGKDLEITGERRPFKGMWQDEDDEDVQVKPEPVSEDEDMADAEPLGNSEVAPPSVRIPGREEEKTEDTEKAAARRRSRSKGKKGKEPVLQTDEEKAEHARFVAFREAVRNELGALDEEDEVERQEGSYLFQLPPILPTLPVAQSFKIKEEPEQKSTPMPPTKLPPKSIKATQAATKERSIKNKVSNGAVGRLRVHDSGRTTLIWGDEVFELVPGNPAGFTQETIDMENVPLGLREDPNEGGDGVSFAEIRGKFVAAPSWKAML